MLILLLSVVCQADSSTKWFIIEFEHNAVFPNQNFSINRSLITLPVNPPDTIETNDYAGLYLATDDKQQRFNSYEVKMTLTASIPWQWLYATHLLTGYELILTTKNTFMSATPYSWLAIEVVVAIGWLLNSDWNLDLPSFNPIEPQEPTSMLTRGADPFAIITMVPDYSHNQQPQQLSESSGKQAPGATSHLAGSFTSLRYSGSVGGNGGPQQTQHTLGFNCFIFPCHGVCSFRPSSGNRGASAWPLNPVANSTDKPTHLISAEAACPTGPVGSLNDDVTMQGNSHITADDSIIIVGLLSLSNHILPEENGTSCTLAHPRHPIGTSPSGRLSSGGAAYDLQAPSDQKSKAHIGPQTCDVTLVGRDGQQRPCGKVYKNAQSLSVHKSSYHTGQKVCGVTLVEGEGQSRLCGTVCKNAQALWNHKKKHQTEQKTCEKIVIGKDGQPRSCGTVCKNVQALCNHKYRYHSEQKTCEVTVIGKNGQPQPCGMICKNVQSLSTHKRGVHSGQQTCDRTVFGKNGLQQPCGKVCKSSLALSHHKHKVHSGQKTCDIITTTKDHQLLTCGKVCKSAKALLDHKRNCHSGQKTCDAEIVGDDDQPRPCGALCKSSQALSLHKSKAHSRRKTCEVTVIRENAQLQPRGTVCKSTQTLSDHKQRDRKRRPDSTYQDYGPSPKESKVTK
ncbi:hypothetical protein [Endozoicomonas sp. ISHI1]|uniref:hypothetical protein n=1 Tax=Endozoicomonas sp. ISHI1 TaxID=2825882 RepID=UPI0021473606|nr:hypothetical protein [Endozoicomonas sp. ISHI1]